MDLEDTSKQLINQAEYAAAFRKLGLSDRQGLALIAAQQRIDPRQNDQDVMRSVIDAAQDLDSQGLGVLKGEKILDPNSVIEFGQDEADLQTLSVAEQQETRDTKERKKAIEAIRARVLDSEKDQRRERPQAFQRELNGDAVYDDGTPVGYAPQRVLERRIAPQDRLDTGSRQTRATGSGLSGAEAAMQDAFYRMDAALQSDPSLRTLENLKILDQLEAGSFSDKARSIQQEEGRSLSVEFENSLNQEIQARNAAKSLTPQESLILERATRGLESMGEVQIQKTGPGKDMVRELPRSTVDTASMPSATYLYGPGGLTDSIGYADGDQMISSNWESSIDSQSNSPVSRPDGLNGLIYDNLYIDSEKNGYPQVGINQSVNLLQSRLQTGIPTKWGTLQNAPTTIRGIDDLDQALQSVISLAGDNNKALVEMPDAGARGKPKVSENPGGLEALKQIGYNRPEAQGLLNAVAQLQMFANNQSEGATGEPVRSSAPINFDSPEQMGDFRVDNIVGPVDKPAVRGLFRGLTGENIQPDLDDSTYTPERVLNMAQQNFSGEVMRTDPNTGEVSNSKPPIGGVSGNKNYMYNLQGIRDLGDLRYALEQQSLRRDARLKREPGDPVRRQVGKVSPAAERNITRSLLATERANRDERTPKALPAAGESLGSRESAFMAEQGRRSEAIRVSKEQSARAALTEPSGRKPLGPGEWVRASDGNVRVMGKGGIPFNREGAIAVNMGNNKSTSYAATAQAPTSDPWSGSASVPNTQAQPSSYQPQQAEDPRGALVRVNTSDSRSRTSNKRNRRLFGGLIGAGVGSALTIDALIENEQNSRQLQGQY